MIHHLLDRYALSARVAPALWALLPAYLTALALIPNLRALESTVMLAVVAGIGALFLSDFVRERGKAAERHLFQSWGGPPTTRRLRLRSAADQTAVRDLRAVVETVSGHRLPDEAFERAEPVRSEAMYENAVAVLRERTRQAHPVVLSELNAYGRKRNTWAIRYLGRTISVVGFVLSVIAACLPELRAVTGLVWPSVFAAVNLLLVAFWFLEVRESIVQVAAERYADALFTAARGIANSMGAAHENA